MYAIIKSGKVVNLIEASADYAASIGAILATEGCSIGASWDGSQFMPPLPPPVQVPILVSRFQAKAALLDAGLLDDFEALMTDPGTPEIAKLAWADSTEFHRQSPTVLAMTQSLGLTSDQVDDLFLAAVLITA